MHLGILPRLVVDLRRIYAGRRLYCTQSIRRYVFVVVGDVYVCTKIPAWGFVRPGLALAGLPEARSGVKKGYYMTPAAPYSRINDGIIQPLSARLAHVAVPWKDTAATQPRTHTQIQRLGADDNDHGNGDINHPDG